MTWTSPRTWVSGEALTASNLNVHVRDNLKAVGDAWTSYAPTWTAATTNPVIGNGTLTGAYINPGKLVIGRIALTMGSTTTYGAGLWSLTLPVTPLSTVPRLIAQGLAFDSSATDVFPVMLSVQGGTTTATVRTMPTTAGNALRNVTDTAPFTWATGDTLTLNFTYEAA